MRTFLLLAVLILAAAGASASGLAWEEHNFAAPGPANSETVVVIKPGSSVKAVANDLAQAGVVSNAILFRIGVLRRGKTVALKAGEYAFPAQTSMAAAMAMLTERKVVQHRITIAEGLTSDAAVALVNADAVLTGPATVIPEGSLLPETYLFERGTTRAEILARMHKAQQDVVSDLWAKRKDGLPFTTPDDAIKLASVVEKETGLQSERPRIAAVFVNRLHNHMRLESDPTIIYGLTKGIPLGHPLRQSELETPNPYSTYQIDGLPPTAICNPGRDAIAAAMNPPDSHELFFVADGNGGHIFANSLAEHQRNVAQLRRREREQNAATATAPDGAGLR
jgi:UPF0755 protein